MHEILYIVPSPFTEKDLPDISKKIRKVMEEMGGKIIKEERLGNKKLAYPIKQVYRGFYNLINFEIGPEKIKELDKKMKLTPEVLRHLIVKVKIKPTLKKESDKIPKEEIIAKKSKEGSEEGTVPEEKREKKTRTKKIDVKKLGEKINELFKI